MQVIQDQKPSLWTLSTFTIKIVLMSLERALTGLIGSVVPHVIEARTGWSERREPSKE